jgi:hypothetical protein
MDDQPGDFFQGEDADFGGQPDFAAPAAPTEGGDAFYEDIGDVDYTDVSGAAAPDAGMDAMQFPPAVMVMDEGAGGPELDFGGGEDNGMMDFAGNEAPPDVMMMGPPPGEEMTPSDGDVFSDAAPNVIDPMTEPEVETKPPEESPMAKWNKEFQDVLKARKDEENEAKAAAVESAQKELEEFQAMREKKREARMAKNRSDEQQKLEDMEADLENDNSWQRVNKMVELQQDTVEGARDKKRIIDVLIKLKNDKEIATALS